MLPIYKKRVQRLIQELHNFGVSDPRVLQAIQAVPRHKFVSESLAHQAYQDTALPIGEGQTISFPSIVGLMTQLLLGKQTSLKKVLEIGTGSGYQTAVLASLVHEVYSIERISVLQYQAKHRLNQLGIYNIKMQIGDGWLGWENQAPFDGIIVTAGAHRLPEQLIYQLHPEGGRMVVPVGESDYDLLLIERFGDKIKTSQHGKVRFVPFIEGVHS